jgi:hypothetical protein
VYLTIGTRATAAVPIEVRETLPFVLPLTLERVPGHLLHSLAMSACLPADWGELAARVANLASASRRRLQRGLAEWQSE